MHETELICLRFDLPFKGLLTGIEIHIQIDSFGNSVVKKLNKKSIFILNDFSEEETFTMQFFHL